MYHSLTGEDVEGWRKRFILSGVLASLAIVSSVAAFYHFTFPPDPIYFPIEIIKTEHFENGTVTITYRWLGDDHETEQGITPTEEGYGYHILVFRGLDEIKASDRQLHIAHVCSKSEGIF